VAGNHKNRQQLRSGRRFVSGEAAMLRQSDLFRLSAEAEIIMRIV
jgi:hypothetical protein